MHSIFNLLLEWLQSIFSSHASVGSDVKMTFIWEVIVQAPDSNLPLQSAASARFHPVPQRGLLFPPKVSSGCAGLFEGSRPPSPLLPVYNGITTYTSWMKHKEALIPPR